MFFILHMLCVFCVQNLHIPIHQEEEELSVWGSISASEITYIVSGGALNSTHSLTGVAS